MVRVGLRLFLLFVPLLAAGAAWAAGMGPLEPLLPSGEIGQGWRGAAGGGAYELSNTAAPGAVRYFYVLPDAAETVEITATVSVEGAEPAAAGLLYGFDPDSRAYCALLLKPDRTVMMVRRTTEGLRSLVQAGGSSVRAGANTLKLRLSRHRVDAFVNGVGVATVAGTAACTGRGVGIMALAPGRFRFSGFQLR